MFSRRFALLAGVLVSLNLALWFASPGLALRKVVIHELFSPKMVRLEVIEKTPVGGSTDWHVDRGVITQVNATQLTLKEADGRIQAIPVSSATKVKTLLGARVPASALVPSWHVVVIWPASGPAMSVNVERTARGPGKDGFAPSAEPGLFGPKMVRLEVVERTLVGGSTDWHVDRGVITQVSPTQLTLKEADGRIQAIPVSSATKVKTPMGARISESLLAPRWRVVVTWPASGAAQSVDVERIPGGRGNHGLGPSSAPASSLS